MDTLIFEISRSMGIMKNAENNLEEQWRAAGRRCARLPCNNLVNMKKISVFVFVFSSIFVFVFD